MIRTVLRSRNPTTSNTGMFYQHPFVWNGSAFSGIDYKDLIALQADFLAFLDSKRNVYIPWTGKIDGRHLGSYLVSAEGPPPYVDSYELKTDAVKVKNPNFRKRSKEGEIIVSDYQAPTRILVRAEARWQTESAPLRADYPYCPLYMWLPRVASPNGSEGEFVTWRGRILKNGAMFFDYRGFKETSTNFMGNYSAEGHARRVLSNLSQLSVNSGSVTTALAAANRGQFDFLSNLAEMPETIKSIFQAISSVLEMYKEAKRGEFRLYNKLSRKLLNTKSHAQERQLIADTAKAVASLWLAFRLAIDPSVGMVYDAAVILRDGHREYFRYRELNRTKVSVAWSSEDCEITILERVCIKRFYDVFVSALGFPPLGAAWELLPLSFVLDRFIDIGSWLSAHLSPNLSVQEGSTYSWKNESGTVTGITDEGISYTVDVSFYKRSVINPHHYCGIVLPDTTTWEQDLDHLALFWNIVVDKYINPKRMK